MQIRNLIAAAGLIALSPAAYSQVLVQTSSDDWSIARNTTVTGTQTSQTLTDTANTNVSVSQYTGSEALTRVVIRYVQPKPPANGLVTGAISITGGSGTVDFTSATASISTSITASNELFIGIFTLGGGVVSSPSTATDADNLGAFSLTGTQQQPIELEYNQTTVLWDSDDHNLTGNLNSLFAGSGNFDFAVASSVNFQFVRNNTTSIQLATSGNDTGFVEIQYYAIPEPSTAALLFGAGAALLYMRRRKNSINRA